MGLFAQTLKSNSAENKAAELIKYKYSCLMDFTENSTHTHFIHEGDFLHWGKYKNVSIMKRIMRLTAEFILNGTLRIENEKRIKFY